MKTSIIVFSLLFSFSSFAKNMVNTENYREVNIELEDGSTQYIGACTLHRDYEGKKFNVTQTIVEYFDMNPADYAANTKNVDPALLAKAAKDTDLESLTDADDLTVEKLESSVIKNLDLYRLDIGVGNGNGIVLIYNKTAPKKTVSYEQVAMLFDGDLEFCESKVWLK